MTCPIYAIDIYSQQQQAFRKRSMDCSSFDTVCNVILMRVLKLITHCIAFHFAWSFAATQTHTHVHTHTNRGRPWTWSKPLIAYLMFYVTNHHTVFLTEPIWDEEKISHCIKFNAWNSSASNSFRRTKFIWKWVFSLIFCFDMLCFVWFQ